MLSGISLSSTSTPLMFAKETDGFIADIRMNIDVFKQAKVERPRGIADGKVRRPNIHMYKDLNRKKVTKPKIKTPVREKKHSGIQVQRNILL